MYVFRNPEMKKSTAVFAVITLALTFIFSFFDIKMSLASLSLGILLTLVFCVVSYNRYKKMKELSAYIDNVLYYDASLNISKSNEGELSILENEIEKMLLSLREKNELLQKDRTFLSNSMADISHQLRTPLTSINIIIALLMEDELTKEKRFELVKELNKLIKRIDNLVTTLLKLSKIDAGTVIFEKKEVRVKELIDLASQPLAIALDVRQQKLSVNCANEIFIGDLSWTAEALGNILKNCSEHCNCGGEISVDVSNTPMYVQISVKDTGNGFFEEDIPYLFDRFYKGKNSTNESFGIGLSLSRAIVLGQNGSIKAQNAKSGGALFIIRFYK